MKSLFSFSRPVVAVAFASLLALPVFGQDKVLLKAEWKQGKTYTTKQTMKQAMTMGEMGTVDADIQMGFGLKAMEGANKGETKLAMAFEKMSMVMDMDMAGQKQKIDTNDTENAAAKPLRDALEPLLKSEIVATLDKDGKLTELTGMEGLASNPQLSGMMSKDMFSQTLSQGAFYGFPDKPVGKGDKWKMNHNLNMGGAAMKMEGDVTMTDLTKVDGHDIATLSVDATMSIDLKSLMEAMAKQPGAENADPETLRKMAPTLEDVKIAMEMKFDATEGYSPSSTGQTTMKMTMNLPEGKKMEMKIKQNIEAKVTAEASK